MFLAVILLFSNFLRPSLNFEMANPVPFNTTTVDNDDSSYLSEKVINQSSQPDFAILSTHIKVFNIFASMFVVSWLEKKKNLIDPSPIMLIQIFNSQTNEPIWSSPKKFADGNYVLPMKICEISYPSKGIMGFWLEKTFDSNELFFLYVQSFYLSEFGSPREKSKIADILLIEIDEDIFDVKYFEDPEFDDYYVVTWKSFDKETKKFKIQTTNLKIEYWKEREIKNINIEDELLSLKLKVIRFHIGLFYITRKLVDEDIYLWTLHVNFDLNFYKNKPKNVGNYSFTIDHSPNFLDIVEIDNYLLILWSEVEYGVFGRLVNKQGFPIMEKKISIISNNFSYDSIVFASFKSPNEIIVVFENHEVDDKSALSYSLYSIEMVNRFTYSAFQNKCKNATTQMGRLETIIQINSDGKFLLLLCNSQGFFGYYIRNQQIDHCDSFSKFTFQCDKCDLKYNLSSTGDVCFIPVENCLTQNPDGSCFSCTNDLAVTKNGAKCVFKIPNCKEYDDETGNCILCEQLNSLTPNGDKCVPSIPRCSEYKENGDCILCDTELSPISKDQNQTYRCVDIWSFPSTLKTNERLERHKINLIWLETIDKGWFIASWLEGEQEKFNLRPIIIETHIDSFIISDELKKEGANYPMHDADSFECKVMNSEERNDNFPPYFTSAVTNILNQGNQKINAPMQISEFDKDSFIAVWSIYQKTKFTLEINHFKMKELYYLSISKTKTMLYDDFLFNEHMQRIKQISDGKVAILYGLYNDFYKNFSAHYVNYGLHSEKSLKLFEFEEYIISQPLIAFEIIEEKLIVVFLTQNISGNFININLYQQTKVINNTSVLLKNCTLGPFRNNSIMNLEILRQNDGSFILFWQANSLNYQKLNIELNLISNRVNIHELEEFPSTFQPLDFLNYSVSSFAILADGRWIVVWGVPLNCRSLNNIYLKIEGEDKIHNISVNNGNYPTVSCKKKKNADDSSSFIIGWTTNTKRVFKIFAAKLIPFCLKYDDNLNFCESCDENISERNESTGYCWKKIQNCSHLDLSNGRCSTCEPNFTLVDEQLITHNTSGIKCFKTIEDCKQYQNEIICQTCQQPNFIFIFPNNFKYGKCVKQIDNCDENLQSSEITCDRCKVNYHLNTTNGYDFCIPEIKNCSRYGSTPNNCSICEKNFSRTINHSKCALNVANCDQYLDSTLKCISCAKGYDPITIHEELHCKLKDEMSYLPFYISLTIIVFVVFLLGVIWMNENKKRKLLEECDDFKLVNLIKNEETLIKRGNSLKKFDLLSELKEKQHLKIQEIMEEMKNESDVVQYELIEEKAEFSNFRQLKKTKKLGKGGYGQVWMAEDKMENKFAVKIFIEESSGNPTDFENFFNMFTEYQVISNLNDPSIIHVFGLAYSFNNGSITLGIVEELMEEDLKSFLEKNRIKMNLKEKLDIAIKISEAFLFLHNKKFVHHDIKPENILISRRSKNQFEIKISDFGTCLKVLKFKDNETDVGESENRYLNGISKHFASPENILHIYFGHPLENNPKSDIWSLGIVFHQIFVSNRNIIFPWSSFLYKKKNSYPKALEITILNEKKKKKNYFVNKREKDLPDAIMKLINRCLQVNRTKRPTIVNVLEKLSEMKT